MSHQDPEEPADFVTDVRADDVTERAQLVETPAGRLALLRDRGRIVAVDAWCPHLDGPLWEGSCSQGEIACPWHGWRYSLDTGACTWAPHGDREEAEETEIALHGTSEGPGGRITVHLGKPPAPFAPPGDPMSGLLPGTNGDPDGATGPEGAEAP